MLLLVVKGIVLWIAYMLIFIAVGSVISIAAIEIDSRYVKTTGMGAALGFWVGPMLLFWAVCIAAAIVVIVRAYFPSNMLMLLVIFLPGMIFGATAVFMVGPYGGTALGIMA